MRKLAQKAKKPKLDAKSAASAYTTAKSRLEQPCKVFMSLWST